MIENRLKQIHTYGQSIWLDFIQRSLMDGLWRVGAHDQRRWVAAHDLESRCNG